MSSGRRRPPRVIQPRVTYDSLPTRISRIEPGTYEEDMEALYTSIERVQQHMHKKADPSWLVELIRARYNSPIYFLESTKHSMELNGLNHLDAFQYAMVPAMARIAATSSFGKKPTMSRLSDMADFCLGLYIGVHVERFYLVMLDYHGKMIYHRLVQEGTQDSAPFDLRRMITYSLEAKAKYIVIVHNHPLGTLQPSQEDLICTLQALNLFSVMNIKVLDHIIVAKNRAVSVRSTGLIPEVVWSSQAPYSKLMKEWINVDLPAGE